MVFNVTFNNISVKSQRSVLLVEETGVPGENKLKVQVLYTRKSRNVSSYNLQLIIKVNMKGVFIIL